MARKAYTYIEILAVITVIGILMGMLLPAVQAAQEATRRTNCSRHLMQLMLAVENYELHHQVYPPGTVDSLRPILTQPSGYHHSWIIHILPFIDQKPISWMIDSKSGVYHPNNSAVRSLRLEVLECPSVPRRPGGYSDYGGVHHDVEAPIDIDNNGVLFLNSRIRYEDIFDGSSHTIFIGEKGTTASDLGWMSGTRATLRNTGSAMNGAVGAAWGGVPLQPADLPRRAAGSADDVLADRGNEELLTQLLGAGDTFRSMMGPEAKDPEDRIRLGKRPLDARFAVGGFGSAHPGGTQFAFGDGSVRFLSQTIAPSLYQNFANRADGSLKVQEH